MDMFLVMSLLMIALAALVLAGFGFDKWRLRRANRHAHH